MDRLEAHRDLEAPADEVAEPQARRRRRGPDATRRRRARRAATSCGDLLEVAGRNRPRVEEAARVVELDAARRREVRRGPSRICAAIAPAGTVSVSVFFQRSHIRQRQGHSRFVRKIVATGDGLAGLRRLRPRRGRRRRGADRRAFRGGRRSRIQRSRAAPPAGYGGAQDGVTRRARGSAIGSRPRRRRRRRAASVRPDARRAGSGASERPASRSP